MVSTPEGLARVELVEEDRVVVRMCDVPPYKGHRAFKESELVPLDEEKDSPASEAIKKATDADSTPEHYRVPGFGSVRDYTAAVLDRDSGIWRSSVEAVRADVLEYVSRAPRKGGVDDLKKARRCLDEMIARLG
mgnify:CR=1 FL=1